MKPVSFLFIFIFITLSAQAIVIEPVKSPLPPWKEFRKMKYPDMMQLFTHDEGARKIVDKYHKRHKRNRTNALIGGGATLLGATLLAIAADSLEGMGFALAIAGCAPLIMFGMIFAGISIILILSGRKRLYRELEKYFKQ